MASAVKTRPNHYEMLGLTPSATDGDIAKAFAREIGLFRPHAFGEVAFLSLAYETLRDASKRRAYDASIGIKPEPDPRHSPWQPVGAHFAEALTVRPAEVSETLPPVSPPPTTPELEMASFIAASLREPAVAEPALGARVQAELPPRPEPESRPQIQSDDEQRLHRPHELHFEEVPHRPTDWKRMGLIAGGLLAVAALPGALLGLWSGSGNAEEPSQPALSKTVPLPIATRAPSNEVPSPAPFQAMVEAPELPRQAALPRTERPRPQGVTAPVASRVESAQLDPTDEVVAEASPAEPIAASMPLPNNVVARTIGRIGYSCGQVASTTPVDGAAGVFKVTCTSGHSYQATPVHGRYHFRRLGSR